MTSLSAVEAQPESLLTVKDLAEYLSVKMSWVYEAVRSKGLPYLKLGAHLRFRRSEIDRWLDENSLANV